MADACAKPGRAADGGVHVPPPSVVGRGPRARGERPDRAAARRPELVLVLQRRPRQHPQHRARSGGGALYDIGCYCVNLSRMLFGAEPTAWPRIERDQASGVDMLTSGILTFEAGIASFTVSTRMETDQRVHIYGTHGRISLGIPFNIPPDRPTQVFVTPGGDPPVAPHASGLPSPADQYGVEADAFAASVLDGTPLPIPPADAVANMRVIDRLFAAA